MAVTPEDYDAALEAGDVAQLVVLFKADESRGKAFDRLGKPLLHRALDYRAKLDRAAAVASLVAAGIDPTMSDRHGTPALHRASYADCGACLAALLEAGVDPNQRGRNGRVALHVADEIGLPLLLASGADPALRDDDGRLPVHFNPVTDDRLLAAGVDVRDRYGMTPLHVAAFRGEFTYVRWLLSKGADAGLETTADVDNLPPGQRPYDLAKAQYQKYRWSTGSKYQMSMDALEKPTPRRSLFRR